MKVYLLLSVLIIILYKSAIPDFTYAQVGEQAINNTTGILVVRSNPAGATFSIDTIEGTFITPHTFTGLPAQQYTIRFNKTLYFDNEAQVTVDGRTPARISVNLEPNYGSIIVRGNADSLWLYNDDTEEEVTIPIELPRPIKLPPGNYTYRFDREYNESEEGTFSIDILDVNELRHTLNPLFATVRVRANTSDFTLHVADENPAPESLFNHIIYLSEGIHEIEVTSPGYESANFTVNSAPGMQIDTTITLVSYEERDALTLRESLPGGIFVLETDANTQIFINGTYIGTEEATLVMNPRQYNIEFRHPLRNRSFSVDLPAAEILTLQYDARPSRPATLLFSTVVPGSGHLYTNRNRGYAYLGIVVGSGLYSYLNYTRFLDYQSRYTANYERYRTALTVDQTREFRILMEQDIDRENRAYNLFLISAGAAALVYTVQMIDIVFTLPEFGYRDKQHSRLSARFFGSGLTLSYSID